MNPSIRGKWVWKEPKDAPKHAERNKIEGQSCLISEFPSMEAREKRRIGFLSLNKTRKAKRMLLQKEKGKGEKIVLQKLQSS